MNFYKGLICYVEIEFNNNLLFIYLFRIPEHRQKLRLILIGSVRHDEKKTTC